MIATAIAIQDATKDAIMDRSSISLAHAIFEGKDHMGEVEFGRAIFEYSAHLSSLTATLILDVVLTESQISEMIDTIKEMDSMGKDITNE